MIHHPPQQLHNMETSSNNTNISKKRKIGDVHIEEVPINNEVPTHTVDETELPPADVSNTPSTTEPDHVSSLRQEIKSLILQNPELELEFPVEKIAKINSMSEEELTLLRDHITAQIMKHIDENLAKQTLESVCEQAPFCNNVEFKKKVENDQLLQKSFKTLLAHYLACIPPSGRIAFLMGIHYMSSIAVHWNAHHSESKDTSSHTPIQTDSSGKKQ